MLRRPRRSGGERHILFCVADHFEPFQKRLDHDGIARCGRLPQEAAALVREWVQDYRRAVDGLTDADGSPPRHTFFYPAEEYDEECLDILADLCRSGLGEVEIHLHHRNDTAEGLRQKIESYRDALRERHGLLGTDGQGRVRYGFVHGNWSLCNSRPDGDWCGVNEELGILSQTGCYADFTFPSAPSPTQPKMVNALYRAADTPGKPRGHDRGVRCSAFVPVSGTMADDQAPGVSGVSERSSEFSADLDINAQQPTLNIQHPTEKASSLGVGRWELDVGRSNPANLLLLVQGPLALDWRRRKWGVLPRLENAEISGANPPIPARVRLWLNTGIHVRGRPEWIFVKIHTHGCIEANRGVLFGRDTRDMHEGLGCGDGGEWRVHYVTAREMNNIARAAEDGQSGNPGRFRDYDVRPPSILS